MVKFQIFNFHDFYSILFEIMIWNVVVNFQFKGVTLYQKSRFSHNLNKKNVNTFDILNSEKDQKSGQFSLIFNFWISLRKVQFSSNLMDFDSHKFQLNPLFVEDFIYLVILMWHVDIDCFFNDFRHFFHDFEENFVHHQGRD